MGNRKNINVSVRLQAKSVFFLPNNYSLLKENNLSLTHCILVPHRPHVDQYLGSRFISLASKSTESYLPPRAL